MVLKSKLRLEVSSYLDIPFGPTRQNYQRPYRARSMSSTVLFRLAARKQPSYLVRSSHSVKRPSPREVYAGSSATVACNYFCTTARRAADKDGQGATGGSGHHEETFEEFTARYAHLAGRGHSICLNYMIAQHFI